MCSWQLQVFPDQQDHCEPSSALSSAWVYNHMVDPGEKEHFVSRLRKYTWKRKEKLLNETRRENMHVNKILESYKIMDTWTFCMGVENFFWLI